MQQQKNRAVSRKKEAFGAYYTMSTMRSRWLLIVLGLLILAVAAFIHFRKPHSDNGLLRASGTIEATKVDVSFQIGGRVAEVAAGAWFV